MFYNAFYKTLEISRLVLQFFLSGFASNEPKYQLFR